MNTTINAQAPALPGLEPYATEGHLTKLGKIIPMPVADVKKETADGSRLIAAAETETDNNCYKGVDVNDAAIFKPLPLAASLDDRNENVSDPTGKLGAAILSLTQLADIEMPERTRLLGDWFKERDLGFVYGTRGHGKTWFVQQVVTSISTGNDLHEWVTPKAVKCLYFDGEMPGSDMQDRLLGMSPTEYANENLLTVNHEVVFEKTGLSMNLTNRLWQDEIERTAVENGVKVIVLDNLSSLCFGMEENSNDDWELMLPWLLRLRRQKISVIIVHHAGTSGRMRGASRREDHAFWVIKCERVQDHDRAEDEKGVRFRTRFEKQRNSQNMEIPREWHFVTDIQGNVQSSCKKASFDDVVYELIDAGIGSVTDVADELKVSKATVSRAIKRLSDDQRIVPDGRKYVVAN